MENATNTYEVFGKGVQESRLKWLGHVLRMKEERITRRVYQWQPSGKRSRGRPSKRWMDCSVEEDLGGASVTKFTGEHLEGKE